MKRVVLVVELTAVMLVAAAPPTASGVVHEIVGQWCADKGALAPPGLLRDGSFAQPLFAAGVVQIVPFVGAAGPGLLIDFDFTKPQIKIAPTGNILQIGVTPVGPLYIEEFVLGDGPPFTKCARLQNG